MHANSQPPTELPEPFVRIWIAGRYMTGSLSFTQQQRDPDTDLLWGMLANAVIGSTRFAGPYAPCSHMFDMEVEGGRDGGSEY